MCEHVIGIIYDYDDAISVTYDFIIKQYEENLNTALYFKNNPRHDVCGGLYLQGAMRRIETTKPSKMFDKRNNMMKRFDFCPECGEKIDWKALRMLAKQYEKEKMAMK